MTNRKSHTCFRLLPKSTTLDDLADDDDDDDNGGIVKEHVVSATADEINVRRNFRASAAKGLIINPAAGWLFIGEWISQRALSVWWSQFRLCTAGRTSLQGDGRDSHTGKICRKPVDRLFPTAALRALFCRRRLCITFHWGWLLTQVLPRWCAINNSTRASPVLGFCFINGTTNSGSSSLKPISQLRFDYDTTTTRLRRKIDMLFFCASNRVECKQARAIRRSRIVVVS